MELAYKIVRFMGYIFGCYVNLNP